MPLLEKQLVIKKSKLPGAGKGLFTKKKIEKGARIVEYKGKIQPWREVKHEDGHNAYLMYINRNTVINAKSAMEENVLSRRSVTLKQVRKFWLAMAVGSGRCNGD